MILTSTARVSTERPGRYGKQLVKHLEEKMTAVWDADAGRGSIILRADEGTASCDLVSGDGVLLVHIEAPEELIGRMEHVVGRHLHAFGRRDGLRIAFRRGNGADGMIYEPAEGSGDQQE